MPENAQGQGGGELFDPEREAELALHYLENVSTHELWTQTFCVSMQVLLRHFLIENRKVLITYGDFFGEKLRTLHKLLLTLFDSFYRAA